MKPKEQYTAEEAAVALGRSGEYVKVRLRKADPNPERRKRYITHAQLIKMALPGMEFDNEASELQWDTDVQQVSGEL